MFGEANTLPTLNAKTIDPEFVRPIDDQTVAKILIRLASEYGNPYEQDAALASQKRIEWSRAIGQRSKSAMELATNRWIASNAKWPKVSELIQIADSIIDGQVSKAVSKFNLHPARVKLPSTYVGFMLREAKSLRMNAKWAEWLNTKHPMVEHSYFADAKALGFEHVIDGMSEFSIDYVMHHFYEELEKHFGRKLSFKRPAR